MAGPGIVLSPDVITGVGTISVSWGGVLGQSNVWTQVQAFDGGAVIKGTVTADDAAAGMVGEYVHVKTPWTAVTNAIYTNLTDVSLTPGDWDVSGQGRWEPASTTQYSLLMVGVGLNGATSGGVSQGLGEEGITEMSPAVSGANTILLPTPVIRLSLAVATTVYLVTQAVFANGTMRSGGTIRARRVR
jgi:hypothetical protein